MTVDKNYLLEETQTLLSIFSPSCYCDNVVQYVKEKAEEYGYETEIMARGDLIARPKGSKPTKAVATHVDTNGAMTVELKSNGRLRLRTIGHWNAAFSYGQRVYVYYGDGKIAEGTILPLKASGHVYAAAVDKQEISFEHVEVRLDLPVYSKQDLIDYGFDVGDLICLDPCTRIVEGFINARHLDNKAAVGAVLAAMKAKQNIKDTEFIFSTMEELGVGLANCIDSSVTTLLNLDIAAQGPGQNVCHHGLTFGMMDSMGPLHPKPTKELINICKTNNIEYTKDCFPFYYCDGDSALKAGADIQHALVCFGADASHGWERVHIDSLYAMAKLVELWAD